MRVKPRKAASPVRQAVPEPRDMAASHMFPAPTRGLVLNENISTVGPAAAQVLDNFVCTPTGIRARGGSQRYATLPSAVQSVFAYRGTPGRLFASTASAIYMLDGSDPNSATVSLSGLSGGDFSTAMFGTAGGVFLIAANGANAVRVFDGSAWAAAAITGTDPAKLSYVWSFANRLFFVERGTTTAHFLPVDSIGGAAAQFSLAGVFKLGGSLMFGATWPMDAGDGLDDKCVFVSTEGEVAVYEGTNPASALDWRLAGVYQITRPLGHKAIMKAGGDLLIATQTGLVPMSQIVQKDPAALSMAAVSLNIEPLWTANAALFPTGWQIAKWPERNIMLVSMASGSDDGTTLCANLQTGGWSRWTNMGARCLDHFDGYVFAGGNSGIVRRLETGGTDMGAPYTAVYVGSHDSFGAPGYQKTAHQALAMFRTSHPINPQIAAHPDYQVVQTTPPPSVPYGGGAVWDSSKWDEAVWDGVSDAIVTKSFWRAIGRTGVSLAPELQLTFAGMSAPTVELVNINVTYTTGALVS